MKGRDKILLKKEELIFLIMAINLEQEKMKNMINFIGLFLFYFWEGAGGAGTKNWTLLWLSYGQ